MLSLLRSPTGGPAYKADLLASPDFSALVRSPRSAEKLAAATAAATAAGIPLPRALADLASQQVRRYLPCHMMVCNGDLLCQIWQVDVVRRQLPVFVNTD